LSANPADEDEDVGSEHSDASSSPGSGDAVSSGDPGRQQATELEPLEKHPLYKRTAQGDDGLWHCPWEGEGDCRHRPSVLRADLEYVRSRPFSQPSLIDSVANSS